MSAEPEVEKTEIIIVGGGPAGLSAALVLARARRKVIVFDAAEPRNAASRAVHCFLTRNGTPPLTLLKMAREEVLGFENVSLRDENVVDVRRTRSGFEISTAAGERCEAKRIVLATGLRDELPKIEGIEKFYGRSVHHCPLCDGWEHQDQPLAVVGCDAAAATMARELLLWSPDVLLFCSRSNLGAEEKELLDRKGIDVIEEKIVRLEGNDGALENLVLSSGRKVARAALFFASAEIQKSDFGKRLGCEEGDDGSTKHDGEQATCVPGVFVVGNAGEGLQLAIVAAAAGAQAAKRVLDEIVDEECGC